MFLERHTEPCIPTNIWTPKAQYVRGTGSINITLMRLVIQTYIIAVLSTIFVLANIIFFTIYCYCKSYKIKLLIKEY